MIAGAALFLIYAIALFFWVLSGEGFELVVATLNGVTPAQLNQLNSAIMGYIQHIHVTSPDSSRQLPSR